MKMMSGVDRMILNIALMLFISNTSYAGKIFVSPSGDDANSGSSPESAFASIGAALKIARPGDEIRLLPGTYVGTTKMWDIHGAPEEPITMMSNAPDSDGFAIIDGGARPALNINNFGFWLDSVSWIAFKNLKFRNCWTDVIYMDRVSYISFIGCDFRGGRRVIYPRGNSSHHFLVENCHWEQDELVYTTYDWDEMHHGSLSYYNGGLFAGKGIGGGFVVRNNVIVNVFNGIRFTGEKTNRRQNANGEIYGNRIINSSDNAFEPEDVCSNLHFYHNTLINSHAFISIDMVRGGPIFFYGNIGWQTENRGHEWTIFKFRGYESGVTPALLDEPIYIFNNSWFVHFDAFGGSSDQYRNQHLRHYNNAYFFTENADFGMKFWGDDYLLDDDCSNVPFPDRVLQYGDEANAVVGDPLFMDQLNGDFRLAQGSPCIDVGRVLNLPEFDWTQDYPDRAPDIGAFEGDERIEGPPFRFREPPGGSYYPEKPRIVRHRADGSQLMIYFSVALDPSSVTGESIHLFQNGQSVTVLRIDLLQDDYVMIVTAEITLDAEQLSLFMDPLPQGKNGETATHWASTIDVATAYTPSLVLSPAVDADDATLRLTIHPNPINKSSMISVRGNSIDRILKTNSVIPPVEIYDIQGKCIMEIVSHLIENGLTSCLYGETLRSGVYVAVVKIGQVRLSTKFLVLK